MKILSITAALALLLGATAATAENWAWVASGGPATAYLDLESISKRGNTVTYWHRIEDYTAPNGVFSETANISGSCKTYRATIKSSVSHDISGNVISSSDRPVKKTFAPGTLNNSVLMAACNS